MGKLDVTTTARGFPAARFADLYGSACSIQDSSLADHEAIWLGVDTDFEGRDCTRMHLDREQAGKLLPLLARFVESGSIAEPASQTPAPALSCGGA